MAKRRVLVETELNVRSTEGVSRDVANVRSTEGVSRDVRSTTRGGGGIFNREHCKSSREYIRVLRD